MGAGMPEMKAEGSKRPSYLSFGIGRRSKSALFEMQWNSLDIDFLDNGDQISYINQQNMIGRESYLHDCVKYRPCEEISHS